MDKSIEISRYFEVAVSLVTVVLAGCAGHTNVVSSVGDCASLAQKMSGYVYLGPSNIFKEGSVWIKNADSWNPYYATSDLKYPDLTSVENTPTLKCDVSGNSSLQLALTAKAQTSPLPLSADASAKITNAKVSSFSADSLQVWTIPIGYIKEMLSNETATKRDDLTKANRYVSVAVVVVDNLEFSLKRDAGFDASAAADVTKSLAAPAGKVANVQGNLNASANTSGNDTLKVSVKGRSFIMAQMWDVSKAQAAGMAEASYGEPTTSDAALPVRVK